MIQIVLDSKKENSDATTSFNAHFVENPTLQEFIEYLVGKGFGSIVFDHPFNRNWGWVSNGGWVTDGQSYDTSRKISLFYMNGGWGQMTYCVRFED